jgi:hypothetical protein
MAFISGGQSVPHEEEIQVRHKHVRVLDDAAQFPKKD